MTDSFGMRRGGVLAVTALIALHALVGGPQPATAQPRSITIGTGAPSGVYHAVGQAVCQAVMRRRGEAPLDCLVQSTSGSVKNVKALRAGDLQMAVVQSDVHYNAVKGRGEFALDGREADLRSVFSLHPEPMTVVARKDAGIVSFADFRGKRFNIGPAGSGTRASIEELLSAMGWSMANFAVATNFKPTEQGAALCDGKIDGFLYAVGHPSADIRETTATCDARLVPLNGFFVDKLVAMTPYYAFATIPGGLYRGNPQPVASYGVLATLMTSSRVPADVVYQVVQAVFDNVDEFKTLHPALAVLRPETMLKNGLTAPMHEGALRYYEAKGWVK
jgi:uncharacterized protein